MLIDNTNISKYNTQLDKEILLEKPSGEPVGFLDKVDNPNLEVDLIGVNTLTFSYSSENHYSSEVKAGKGLRLKAYQERKVDDGTGTLYNPVFYEERFYITEINKTDGGKNTIKVTAKSNYSLLGSKIVQGYAGVKKFYRTDSELAAFTPGMVENGVEYETLLEYENSGFLNYIMKLIPDWTVDTVSSTLESTYREVDFQEESVLDIFTSFVPETFEGIAQFDTINKTIAFITVDDLGSNEGLIVENEQMAKKIKTDIKTSDWVTKLYVFGAENITIAPVNPTGDNYILNLNHILNSEFMSQSLIDSVNDYNNYVETKTADFETLLSELSTLESQLQILIDEKHFAENELADLRSELDTTIIRYANTDEVPTRTTEDIVLDINAKQREIGNKFTEVKDLGVSTSETVTLTETYMSDLKVYLIDNNYAILGEEGIDYTFSNPDVTGIDGSLYQKVVLVYNANFSQTTIEEQINSKESEISTKETEIYNLRESLKADNYFTESEFKSLQVFIKEKVYRNENITDRQELYDKGLEVLNKINSPQVSIDVDTSDFLNSLKYKTEWDKLKVGSKVNVIVPSLEQHHVEMRLVGFNWSFNRNQLSLKLSSSNRQNNDTFELEDLLSRANKAATNISVNASKYGAYVESGERNELLDYINSKLDLSAQEASVGRDQEITFDNGIQLANVVDDGRKIKLLNNMMVVTSDNFKTADVAITPDGVIAERLIGELILGTEMIIKSSNNQSFIINQDGIQINGSDLTINGSLPSAMDNLLREEQNYNGITIGATNGFIAERTDELVRTGVSATDGFRIENRTTTLDPYKTVLYADTDGKLYLDSVDITSGVLSGGGQTLIDVGNRIIDFTGFTNITPDAGLLEGITITDDLGNITFAVDTSGNISLAGSIQWLDNIPGTNLDITSNSDFSAIQTNVGNLQDFRDVTYPSDISDLQNQIDGNITTWFYDYEPTTSNIPASNWTTIEEKDAHLGDLFYDTGTGYAYRYIYNTDYAWLKITDVDVTKALADAAEAQDTADSKRRVFTTTPTPPYDVGDLWSEGPNGELRRCITAKTEGQTYSSADWELATKYNLYEDTNAEAWFSSTKIDANGIFTENVGGNNIFGSNITTKNLTDSGSTQHHIKLFKDSISVVDDSLEEIKMFISMKDNGAGVNIPGIVFGAGDTNGYMKGYIEKDTDSFNIYYQDSTGVIQDIALNNTGIYANGYKILTNDTSNPIPDDLITSATEWNNKINQQDVEGSVPMNIPKGQFDATAEGAVTKADGAIIDDGDGTYTINGSLSWSNVTDQPIIPDEYTDTQAVNAFETTYIDSQNVFTANVYANKVTGNTFSALEQVNIGSATDTSAGILRLHSDETWWAGFVTYANIGPVLDIGNMNDITSTSVAHMYQMRLLADTVTIGAGTPSATLDVNGQIIASGNITGSKVYGAVFNDYAEYRPKKENIEPGYIVCENENGKLDLNTKKRNRNIYVVSDTYGMVIGDESGLPIATSGRVLTYYEGDLKVGDEVVTTSNGKIRRAKWWEKFFFSVGHVSEIPDYEEWGTEEVKVKGRVWINLK